MSERSDTVAYNVELVSGEGEIQGVKVGPATLSVASMGVGEKRELPVGVENEVDEESGRVNVAK